LREQKEGRGRPEIKLIEVEERKKKKKKTSKLRK
jgi:hypothetical protein